MFTGIVEEVGTLRAAAADRLEIQAQRTLGGLAVADSIAVNGACLTVIERLADGFAVNVVPETLRRTNLGDLRPGDSVNLERSMLADGRLGGHIVQGHVDGTGRLVDLTPEGNALIARIETPASILRYVVTKGFIAIDGTSLTVVDVDDAAFTVALIPYTVEHTATFRRGVGVRVNLEIDILAKYVERLMVDRPTAVIR